jgi:hypothetical protein
VATEPVTARLPAGAEEPAAGVEQLVEESSMP